MRDVITDKLVDLATKDLIETIDSLIDNFDEQGESACRNMAKFFGFTPKEIDSLIDDLKGLSQITNKGGETK